MIIGNVSQLARCRAELPAAVYQALRTISGWDVDRHPDGELTENGVVYKTFHATTAPAAERRAETHAKNIDVQLVLSGQEYLKYQPALSVAIDDPHPADDNFFYSGKTGDEQTLLLRGGDFVVLFPWDIHTPLCQVGAPRPVRKIVAKVPLALLTNG